MINIKKWDIVWCDLGDDGRGSEQSGGRPCVVIQNNTGNVHSPTTVVACITTKKKPKLPTHVKFLTHEMRENTILFEQIRTIDKCRIERVISNLPEEYIAKCEKALYIELFK